MVVPSVDVRVASWDLLSVVKMVALMVALKAVLKVC